MDSTSPCCSTASATRERNCPQPIDGSPRRRVPAQTAALAWSVRAVGQGRLPAIDVRHRGAGANRGRPRRDSPCRVDARWLAKRYEMLTDALTSVVRPVAVVLADRADPLADGRAVMGLRWLAARLHHLSILRSDHGALGAVAFGADHASIGLTTSTRHFAASGMKPFRLLDDSARLFVRQLLDWFRVCTGRRVELGRNGSPLRVCSAARAERSTDTSTPIKTRRGTT